jgi:glycosyltransferase involved in cell wall biosynthesis
LIAIRHIKKADAIYAVSVPLPVGIVGFIYSRLLNADFYFELTDIWPDVLIEMGFLRNRLIIGILKWMESFCYRKAKKIVTLGHLAKLRIAERVDDKNKILVITNGIDGDLFPEESEIELIEDIKAMYSLKGKTVCMYMGAFGRYNALETVVNAAARLEHNDGIRFVFIGDGDEKARLKRMGEQKNLHNMVFIKPIPRSESPAYLQMADIFILPNLRGSYYAMNLQNKLFDYLASAKPIVFAGSGESADVILKSGSGKVVEAENDLAVASAIEEIMAMHTSDRIQMGKNGRAFVLEHYERSELARQLIQVIECPKQTARE